MKPTELWYVLQGPEESTASLPAVWRHLLRDMLRQVSAAATQVSAARASAAVQRLRRPPGAPAAFPGRYAVSVKPP